MPVHLPNRFLVQFEYPHQPGLPDWQERGSYVCLYLLRAALGVSYSFSAKDCPEPSAIVFRTNYLALQLFAGLLALTLFLPFTIVGFALYECSHSHTVAYQIAKQALHLQQKIDTDMKKLVTTYPISRANEKRIIAKHTELFSKMSDEELALHLPAHIESVKAHSVNTEWLDPQRCINIARMLVNRMKRQKADFWATWKFLWEKWEQFQKNQDSIVKAHHAGLPGNGPVDPGVMQDVTHGSRPANLEKQRMLHDALNVIGADPAQLAACFNMTAHSPLLIQLLTIKQLTLLTTELNKSKPSTHAQFLKLATIVAHLGMPKCSLYDQIQRVATIPIALNQNPSQWIQQFPHSIDSTKVRLYYVLHDIAQIFRTSSRRSFHRELHRARQITKLSEAMQLWRKSVTNDLQWVAPPLNMAASIAKLSMRRYDSHAPMIAESLWKVCQAVPSVGDEAENRVYHRYMHYAGREILHSILGMPQADLKAQTAFEAFLPFSTDCERSEFCKDPFICLKSILPLIKTKEVLRGALDAAIRVPVKLDNEENPFIKQIMQGLETSTLGVKMSLAEGRELFQQRRNLIETPVKEVLDPVLPTVLVQMILSYFLSVGSSR